MSDNMNKLRFRDLSIHDKSLKKAYLGAIERVYEHGRFILGPEVCQLEKELCLYSGRRFCRTVNSGTFALYAVLEYIKEVSGSGRNEIILPSISWIATAQAVIAAGLKPIFVDIDDNFFINIEQTASAISSKTLGVIAVDFTGMVSPKYQDLVKLTENADVFLLQDSAQSFGAYCSSSEGNRLQSCGIGFASTLSINSMKILPSHGEGGAIFTDDKELASFVDQFRYQGCIDRVPERFGLNGRMETLQAAITLVSLNYVDSWIDKRRAIAQIYNANLAYHKGINLATVDYDGFHTYYSYQIQVADRDSLMRQLESDFIEYQLQYPYLLPDVKHLKDSMCFPLVNARRLAKTSICLPCNEKMSQSDALSVLASINKVLL